MNAFAYRNGQVNQGGFTKASLDKPAFLIDWSDGLASGVTVSSVATVALDSTGSTVTTNCVSSTTNSGALTTVSMLTCGTSGTGAAPDGARFRLRVTATLSTGILIYDVLVYIRDKAYLPS